MVYLDMVLVVPLKVSMMIQKMDYIQMEEEVVLRVDGHKGKVTGVYI